MPNPFLTLPRIVKHSMTIRIAIVGIPDVDTNQLIWNLESTIEPSVLTTSSPQRIGGQISYGTQFDIKYDVVRVSSDTLGSLQQYLQSIGQEKQVPDSLTNSYYYSWTCLYIGSVSCSDTTKYLIFNATQTESWVNSHIGDFGGIPSDGYTIIVADVSSAFKEYHYYESTFNDTDIVSANAKYHDKAWPMIGWSYSWGGEHRFYYIDLSAGDPFYDYSNVGHIPIQEFNVRYYEQQQVNNKRNPQTITSYVADYIAEATRNLILPSYAYSPEFSPAYKIVINVFDQTGKITDSNITAYLSASKVKSAFEALVPYSSWDISVAAHNLTSDSALNAVLSNNTMFSTTVTGKYESVQYNANYYDDRAVYSYLQQHISEYCPDSTGAVVLPVFAFVFNDASTFGLTSEESVQRPNRFQSNSVDGETMGDMAIVDLNSAEIFDYGYGLTQPTIHELGHMMGLMHPHQYGSTEGYVTSPMSYVTYAYNFSRFDIDAIQRAHADYFLANTQIAMSTVANATLESNDASSILSQAERIYQSATTAYSSKNYAGAVTSLQQLSKLLDQVFDTEASAIQDRAQNATTITSAVAKEFLNNATIQIDAARRQKALGNLGLAYEFLAQAGVSINNSFQAEAQAQVDENSRQTAYNTALMLGLGIGIAIGLGSGLAVGIFLRKKNVTSK